jgi:alcohol dehydrogenase class IV
VRALAARAGVGRLSELGVEADELDAVVEAAERRLELATTPGSPGRDELRSLLAAAL